MLSPVLAYAFDCCLDLQSHSGCGSREHALMHSGRAADEAIALALQTGVGRALALSSVARWLSI